MESIWNTIIIFQFPHYLQALNSTRKFKCGPVYFCHRLIKDIDSQSRFSAIVHQSINALEMQICRGCSPFCFYIYMYEISRALNVKCDVQITYLKKVNWKTSNIREMWTLLKEFDFQNLYFFFLKSNTMTYIYLNKMYDLIPWGEYRRSFYVAEPSITFSKTIVGSTVQVSLPSSI